MKFSKYSKFFRFFGIALFIYILSRIDVYGLIAAFREISAGYYLLAILFLIFGFLIRTLKWKRLITSIGAKISAKDLFEIMIKATFLGVVTPGKLGEFWRAKYLADSGPISNGSAFYTAFMDRLIDLLVLGLVAIPGLLIIYLRFNVGAGWQLYILIFTIFIFLFFVFLKKIGLQKIFKMFVKEKNNIFLAEFDAGLSGLKMRLFLEILIYGFLYYLASVLILYFTALALSITVPFWYLFLVAALVLLILTLPLTFFGLGVREAGFIYFFSMLGISPPLTVAFSLLGLFSYILISLPGAILFLKQK